MHSRVSGVTDHYADAEEHALALVRDIVGRLNRHAPELDLDARARGAALRPTEIGGVVPADTRIPYDVREVIARLVDGSRFQEFKALYGTTLVSGFARIDGLSGRRSSRTTASCSPRARSRARTSSSSASQRAIPLLFLQNITGFMVGKEYEAGGIAKDGAKLVQAVAAREVPKITVIIGG